MKANDGQFIYLASPYSHQDPAVMRERFDRVCEIAAYFMRQGIHLYSPIAHTHPIAQFGLPKGWEFWKEYDKKILGFCSELWVVRLDGWKASKGVHAEIKIAEDLGLSVTYLLPEKCREGVV